MIVLNICLSDIQKDKITKANNGKSYASIIVDERREADKFGNTHTVYMNQTKEQRQARENKVYVGSGKEYVFENQTSKSTPTVVKDGDDLPF